MNHRELRELDLAALRRDLPLHGLVTGDIGTVVFVHNDGRAYEVEFMAADGRTIAVETLDAGALEALSGEQILHVRKLASA